MGDLLGFKGVIVNLVIRKVKKMVPAWSIPGAVSFNDALAAGRGMKLNKPQLTREDVAFLQYTGGTTGVSKGATLLHQNILANVLQNDASSGLRRACQADHSRIANAAAPSAAMIAIAIARRRATKAGVGLERTRRG